MTDTPPASPIIVNATPAPDQLVTAVRQAILIAAAAATALGASNLGTTIGQLAVVAGPVATLITIVAGQLHQRHQSTKLAAMANALPDSVAKTK